MEAPSESIRDTTELPELATGQLLEDQMFLKEGKDVGIDAIWVRPSFLTSSMEVAFDRMFHLGREGLTLTPAPVPTGCMAYTVPTEFGVTSLR